MNYEEARSYVAAVSKTGSILGLESIKNLMRELGDVQERLAIIHIAGTNGKGSTGAFLESVLRHAGKKVGRYTSPAVFEPLEVWRVNGCNISKEDYAALMTQVKDACLRMTKKGMAHPTVFEVETALAFLYFYQEKCDYVLLEVGMGGGTDATNLITHPVCAVLTSISMDHMQFLGNTLGEIAAAKAGIIKKGCPVVTARQKEEAMTVIRTVAERLQAPLWIADAKGVAAKMEEDGEKPDRKPWQQTICYEYPGVGMVHLALNGSYQVENSYLAITVLHEVLHILADVILEGMRNTCWPGRFETISEDGSFVIDGAHNEDAALKLRDTVQNYFTNREITYIIGVLADKEHEKMLKIMLPFAREVYTVTPPNPRAMTAQALAKEAAKYHDNVTACDSIREAVCRAVAGKEADGVILAFGSLSYLAKLKEEYKKGQNNG